MVVTGDDRIRMLREITLVAEQGIQLLEEGGERSGCGMRRSGKSS